MKPVTIIKEPVYCRVQCFWEIYHKLGNHWSIWRGQHTWNRVAVKGAIRSLSTLNEIFIEKHLEEPYGVYVR